MNRTFNWIIYLGLIFLFFALPLFFTIWNTSFVPVKDFFAEMVVLLLAALWLIHAIQREDYTFLKNPSTLPILIFGLILVTSLFHTVSLYDSLRGLARWGSYILLYFVVISIVRKRSQVRWLLGVVVAAGFLAAVYAIFQFYGIDFPFWLKQGGRGRLFSTFGNPNYLAGYLIACLPIAFISFTALKDRLKKISLEVVIVVLYTAVLMTYTRASWAALLVSALFTLVLLFFYQGRRLFRRNRSWLIGLALILLAIFVIYSTPNAINWGESVAGRAASSFEFGQSSLQSRFLIWFSTIEMAKWHPLIGSGIGTFGLHYPEAQGRVLAEENYERFIPQTNKSINAHNEYLHLWAEIGILGLLPLAWIVIFFYAHGLSILKRVQEKDKFLLIGFLGSVLAILAHSFFSFPFHIIQNGLVFWLVLSLGSVLIKQGGFSPEECNGNFKEEIKRESILKPALKRLIQAAVIAGAVFVGIFIVKVYLGDAYAGKGRIFAMGENYRAAAIELEKAARIDPHNGKIYRFLGPVYNELGEYELAIDALKKAEANWKFQPMYSLLGLAYLKTGELEEAEQALRKGIYLFPNWAANYYNLGNLYVVQAEDYLKGDELGRAEEKLDEALYYYEQARAFDQDQGLPLCLIKAYHQLGLKIEEKGGILKEFAPFRKFFSQDQDPILGLVPTFGESGDPVYIKIFYWDPNGVQDDLKATVQIDSGAETKTLELDRRRRVSDRVMILGGVWKPEALAGECGLSAQIENRGRKVASGKLSVFITEKGQPQCEIMNLEISPRENLPGFAIKFIIKNREIDPLRISGRIHVEDLQGKLVAEKQMEVGFETIPSYGTAEVKTTLEEELLPGVYRAIAIIIYGGNKVTTAEHLFTVTGRSGE